MLGLLERAAVPPLPAFYSLLFDYVANVKGLKSSRVDAILANRDGTAGDRLYAEFVAPYANDAALEHAAGQMSARLEVLDALLVESASAAADHGVALASAREYLASGSLDVGLVREWVSRLHEHTQRVRKANAALTEELADARLELEQTRAAIMRSRETALLDHLTGVANRSGLDTTLTQLRKEYPDEPLSVALLDIDHFKSLNDSYGHQVGDHVLLLVVRAIQGAVRRIDTVGRPGGDEFIVILPSTGLHAAHRVADGIRVAIESSDLSEALGEDILGGITVSLGVAQLQPGESLVRLFARADRCLFQAKQTGRNRVHSVDGP